MAHGEEVTQGLLDRLGTVREIRSAPVGPLPQREELRRAAETEARRKAIIAERERLRQIDLIRQESPKYATDAEKKAEALALSKLGFIEQVKADVDSGIVKGRDTSNAVLATEQFRKDQAKDKIGTDTILTSLLSSSSNDGYQPTTGWDRLFATLAGMGGRGSGAPIGTSGFNAFLGDFVGSSQDLATQEAKAATAQADRDILGEKLAGTQAYRDEGRAIEKQRLALAQKKDDRDKFGKAPNLNKNTIEGMEAILDASGLDYSALWDNVWDFLPGKDKGEKADARTAIASTALQIQITTPRLRGNPKEALRQAIENLSGGSAGQDPSVGPSISNAASVNIVN